MRGGANAETKPTFGWVKPCVSMDERSCPEENPNQPVLKRRCKCKNHKRSSALHHTIQLMMSKSQERTMSLSVAVLLIRCILVMQLASIFSIYWKSSYSILRTSPYECWLPPDASLHPPPRSRCCDSAPPVGMQNGLSYAASAASMPENTRANPNQFEHDVKKC